MRGSGGGRWGRLGESGDDPKAGLTLSEGQGEGKRTGRKHHGLQRGSESTDGGSQSSSQVCPAESCVSRSLAESRLWEAGLSTEATLGFPGQQQGLWLEV